MHRPETTDQSIRLRQAIAEGKQRINRLSTQRRIEQLSNQKKAEPSKFGRTRNVDNLITQEDLDASDLYGTIEAQKWEISEINRNISEQIEEPMMELFRSRPSREDIREHLDNLDQSEELNGNDIVKSSMLKAKVIKALATNGVHYKHFNQLRKNGKVLEAELDKAKAHLNKLERDLEAYQEPTRKRLLKAGPAALNRDDILRRANIRDSEPSRDMNTKDLKERVATLENIIRTDNDIQTIKSNISKFEYDIGIGDTTKVAELQRANHALQQRRQERDRQMGSLPIQSMHNARYQYQHLKNVLSGHLDDIIKLDDNIKEAKRYREHCYTDDTDSKSIAARKGAEEVLSELQQTLAWQMESLSIQSTEEAQRLYQELQ
jgi:hypothetical protein